MSVCGAFWHTNHEGNSPNTNRLTKDTEIFIGNDFGVAGTYYWDYHPFIGAAVRLSLYDYSLFLPAALAFAHRALAS